MSRLFLRFYDDSFDEFDWTIFEPDAAAVDLSWQQSNEAGLSHLISMYSLPIVIVLPQQNVYLTEFEVPQKASRQILTSIEYQIEDQLAQDTETQHYALGKQVDNIVPIAVVEQSVMESCQSLQGKHRLRVVQIIPENFLCPWSNQAGEVGLLPSQHGLLLRYGAYQGVKCQPEVLPSVLNLINRQVSIDHVNCYVNDESVVQDLNFGDYPINFKPTKTTILNFDDSDVINLQQRQFQASSHWARIFQVWKGVGAAAMVLLAIVVFNQIADLRDKEDQLRSIKAHQYELIKDHVSAQIGPGSNSKKEMIKLLQQNNDTRKQVSFLDLLLTFSQARAPFTSVDIVKIGYQQERLSVDISSKQLNDVEALHASLNAKGLSTKLNRLNIKPELVSGQFVLQDDDNG